MSKDRFDAMRATVTQTGGLSEATLRAFLCERAEFRGRAFHVVLEQREVQAGVSAGHVFFSIESDAHAGHYVVRFDTGAQRLFHQTSLKDQFDVMRALGASGLAVPEACWFDPDGVIVPGAAALIMRRIEAEPPHMLYMENGPYVEAAPARRRVLVENLMGFCVALHSLPVESLGLAFLSSRGGSGQHFIDREITWMQSELHSRFPAVEEGERAPVLAPMRRTLDAAAAWLRERAPRHRTPVLVHGDITLANVFFNADGSVAAMVDWELCHEGLPEEDALWLSAAARSSARFYKASMLAMPSTEEVVGAYRSAGGVLEDLEFAAALTAFRMLSIVALAMRAMPAEFWPTQRGEWDAHATMLSEAMAAFERR